MGGGNGFGAVNLRAREAERRMAPVVVAAALLSVPAVFCEVWGSGAVAVAGRWANIAAGAVLWAEWGLLFLLAEGKRAWLREHRWSTLAAAAAVLAVVLVVGPLQMLRLARVAVSLRLLRASRILKAGRVLNRRTEPGRLQRALLTGAVALLVAVFSLAVLADPQAESRRLAEAAVQTWGVGPVAAAGAAAVAAAAGALLWRRMRLRPGVRGDGFADTADSADTAGSADSAGTGDAPGATGGDGG
ncbi:hypothetical protein O4J56_16075 [Nocardiopsis sp. RSe5-2]|uniref:Uncharacterized protein n=1 Tax=Nocardiopsis endophytica TaxID=3018445 RepID=A0ABT4U5C7_9ACTN|nr:hypothetical protein [Nocardiopsis endophytica]MDA2812163.1 hypothetical protein [Nocardiopsis endophytica]